MDALDLCGADEQTLDEIISQAQLRIEGQNCFATAADQRASTITAMSAALAAASLGVAGQAYTTVGPTALMLSSLVASIGFSLAAWFALQSARCVDFHPAGFRPCDFIGDVQTRKSRLQSKREIASDYDVRLNFNNGILVRRGRWIDRSILTLSLSPLVAAAFFVGFVLF